MNKEMKAMVKQVVEATKYAVEEMKSNGMSKVIAETYALFVNDFVEAGFSRGEAIEIICNTNPLQVSTN